MPKKSKKAKKKPKHGGGPRTKGRLQQAIDKAAEREIRKALREEAGNVSATARVLGVSQTALWARLGYFGIKPVAYR